MENAWTTCWDISFCANTSVLLVISTTLLMVALNKRRKGNYLGGKASSDSLLLNKTSCTMNRHFLGELTKIY